MELRPLREVEERTRQRDPEGTDPANAVVLATVLALRQTVRERGTLPFDFAALRVLDDLQAVGQTLDHCLAKGGTLAWPGSACWSGGRWPGAAPAPPNCGWPMTRSSHWLATWTRRPILPPDSRPPGQWSAPASNRCWTH